MQDHDPVDTLLVEDEGSSSAYEVPRSDASRFRAEALVNGFVKPLVLEGNEAEDLIAEEKFDQLCEFLIIDTQKRLRLPES